MLLPSQLDRLRVVLVATRNSLNIGAAARAMSNFGFLRLRVVTPYEVAFRDARSAVGAADLLAGAEEYSSIAEAVADCSLVVGTTAVGGRDLHHPLQRLEAGARIIVAKLASKYPALQANPNNKPQDKPQENVALLFGSEKRGLSNQDISYCDWLMHIPTRAEHISMNLGQAVAVCLYEIIRDGDTTERISTDEQAAAEQIERVTTVLLDALLTSGYMDGERQASTAQIARRLVHRMKLDGSDAKLLLGMLRQILWKLRADHRE